ncbi:PAS domain-containing protein [Derxia gummosa]|uniref:histidine kinase n=1 Tax=Derxia gummosa DSM 723 TaxID=1121388 RepID=A0A8B6X6G9_9BURK|nr:PAS domain-containing protein [Derxia gummosa]
MNAGRPLALPESAAAAEAVPPDADPAPRRARGLIWAVIVLSALICVLFVSLHFGQRRAIDRLAHAIDDIHRARIELAHALDTVEHDSSTGLERELVLGEARRAATALAGALAHVPDADTGPERELPAALDRLAIQLDAFQSAPDPASANRLRQRFLSVEQHAERVDAELRAQVNRLDDEQAGQFRAAACLSVLLLAGIGAVAFATARAQRESERALVSSRRLFETLARISPVGIYRTDAFGNEVYSNARCRDIRGLVAGESGRDLDEHVHPADRDRVRARWCNAVEDMRAFHDEYRLLHADGREVWVLNQAVPEVSPEGFALGYVGTLTDITGRKRAELLAHGQRAVLELIASGRPVEVALDALIASVEELDPELVCLVTRAGPERDAPPIAHARGPVDRLLVLQDAALSCHPQLAELREARGRCAPAFVRLAGLPCLPASAAGPCGFGAGSMWFLPLTHDERRLGNFAVFRRSPAAPDAEQLNVIETAAHTAAICLQRHRDEAALRSSEQRFRQLAQTLPQLVWAGRADGRCEFAGPQWTEFTGCPADELLGFAWLDHVHPDDRAALQSAWDEARSTGGLRTELRLRRRDGSYRWLDVRAVPLLGDDGRVLRWFGTGTDVTESRALRDALHRANTELELKVAERTAELSLAKDAAEASNRLKSEFLASMSHELRTPLHAILGFTDMLLRGLPGPLNPAQTRQLGNVHTSARHLLSLINDLLDVARVESGKTRLNIAPLDAGVVVSDAVEVLRSTAAGKHLDLELKLPAEPAMALADQRALTQIVINLVGNAIKFTDAGWVRVEVGGDGKHVRLSVTDSGCGISHDDQSRLFQAFIQADKGRHHLRGGTGLGLYLCRRLSDEQGGHITLESEPGRGSRFTLLLPAATAELQD